MPEVYPLAESARRGLSIFLQTPTDPDPARTYAEAIEVVVLAERLGYDAAWLAEAHFASIGPPSALTFLAAAAQRTSRIRLGTAVVPIVFDHPIRLAETAALTDYLSGGRLEFGVGKTNGGGFSAAAFAAFQLSEDDKDTLYDAALVHLRQALSGVVEGRSGPLDVYPSPRGLLARLWQATATRANAAAIGRAGDGLLLHRLAFEGKAGPVQSGLIDHYLHSYSAAAAPRIGVSRSVLPAESRADAVALIRDEFARSPERYTGYGAASAEEFLVASNVHYGTVDEIAEELGADEAVARSTDYLFSMPLPSAAPHFLDGLRAIADDIFPQLPLGQAQIAQAGISSERFVSPR